MNDHSEEEFLAKLKTSCIALTGGIATGKSTIANILRSKGFAVIDADKIARDIVRVGHPAFNQIVQVFGAAVLNERGELNRETLRTIVMSNSTHRKQLEDITHPAIQQEFRSLVEQMGLLHQDKPFFYEAALIYETGRNSIFKAVWVTHCPEATQIERLCKRSQVSQDDAKKIIAAQMPAAEKAKRADVVIETDCSLAELAKKLEDYIKILAI